MPWAAPKVCARPGCGARCQGRYCPDHQAEAAARRREFDQRRGSATARGYDEKWRRLRLAYLARHARCEECLAKGITEAAEVVDHITPHHGDPALLYDWKNLRALSKRCHDAKTSREDSWNRRRG